MSRPKTERLTAVYWGRFNPPHKGHLGVIRRFKDRYHLVIGIGSSEYRNVRTNPFSGLERKAMLEAYLKEAGIEGVSVVTLNDGSSETWAVDNLIRTCKPDAVILSTENRGQLDAALSKSGVRVVRFRRTGTVSSTLVRHLIAMGDSGWRRLTGKSVAKLVQEFGGIERIRRIYHRSATTSAD